MTDLKNTFIPLQYRPKVKGENMFPEKFTTPLNLKNRKRKMNAIVCFYLKDDCSQTKAIQKNVKNQKLVFLTYDDIGILWNFSFFNGVLTIYTQTHVITPIGIYNRAYCPHHSDPKFDLFCNFLKALECWKGKSIGAKAGHFHNCSKPFQSISTIKTAIEKSGTTAISMPKSYVIKGAASLLQKVRNQHKDLIVKSSSGIRSEVSDYEIFRNWDVKALQNLPTLFQHACRGPDIRVHWMGRHCYSVILKRKEGSIDCRYAKDKTPFEKHKIGSELRQFSKQLAGIENLKLVGVDYIQVGDKYMCLESNPNPGWAGFHRHAKDEPLLARALITSLEKT